MGIFGSSRTQRQAIADPAAGQVYIERRPGESAEAFEARLAAAARERTQPPRFATGAKRPVVADSRRADPPRPRRRAGFGLVGIFVVLIAAVGVLWMVLAAREGSFAAGGAVVDQKLAEVTNPARVAVNQAADRTGAAVQNAGQSLEAKGEALREKAK
jgi:hypothetical protein